MKLNDKILFTQYFRINLEKYFLLNELPIGLQFGRTTP